MLFIAIISFFSESTATLAHNYEFDSLQYILQGLIMSGWSRYDHLAILAETLPVGIPSLAMSMETIMEARPMNGTVGYV